MSAGLCYPCTLSGVVCNKDISGVYCSRTCTDGVCAENGDPGSSEPPPATPEPRTEDPETPESSGSSKNTGAIIGGVVGGVAGIALIGGVIYYFFIK